MQVDNNWYWNQHPRHHVITVITRTILYPQLEVNTVIDFHAIIKSVCTRKLAKQYILRKTICLTDADYYYILKEIGRKEKLSLKDM